MRLSDIPIKRKLPFTIGVGLFLFCGVVLLYTLTLSKTIASYEHLQGHEMAIRWQASRMASQILQARREEKDFLARKDPVHALGVADHIAQALESAREVRRLAPNTERSREILEQLILTEYLEKYATLFQSIADGWQERGLDHQSGLQGRFRAAAHDLEESFLYQEVEEHLAELEQLLRLTMVGLLTQDAQVMGQVAALGEALRHTLGQESSLSATEQAMLAALQAHAAALVRTEPLQTPGEVLNHPAHLALQAVIGQVRQQIVPGARTSYLTIRRLEKDYLLRQEGAYLTSLEKEGQTLTARIQNAVLPAERKSRMATSLAHYLEAFGKLAAMDDRLQGQMVEMRATVRQTEPLTEQIGVLAEEMATLSAAETRRFAEESARFIFVVCLVTILCCGLLSFVIVRAIVRAISLLWHFSHQVAGGDLEATTALDSRDEIGQLALVMGEMVNRMRAMRLIADRMVLIMSLVARGAIPDQIEAQFQGDFQKMAGALNDMIHRLRDLRLIADHVDRISRGEIPGKLDGVYQGDFKRMADAINAIIEKLQEMGGLSPQERFSQLP